MKLSIDCESPCPRWVKLRRTKSEQMSSGLPPKADMARCSWHVSNVPMHNKRHAKFSFLATAPGARRRKKDPPASAPERLCRRLLRSNRYGEHRRLPAG